MCVCVCVFSEKREAVEEGETQPGGSQPHPFLTPYGKTPPPLEEPEKKKNEERNRISTDVNTTSQEETNKKGEN